jgi:serine/threonine-protein kinase
MGASQAHVRDDALATLPAPPTASQSLTLVPARHAAEEVRDLQRATRRLLLLGTSAWPFFFFVDWLGAYAEGAGGNVLWLAGWRLLGALLGALAYFALRDVELSLRLLRAIDAGVFAIGSALITLMAIPIGGLTSRFVTGVVIFVFARAALVPSHWRHALAVSLVSALMPVVTLAAGALIDADLLAQWRSPRAVLVFAHDETFVIAAAIIGSIGSHLVWMARKQVRELRRLGSYRLRSCIGIGGVGEVWRAWQDPPGREVALKVLRAAAIEDAEAVRRFEREARAASALTHPNTVHVFDYGETEDGVRYIAMELLHGMNVDAIVRADGPMPAGRVIHLAAQACASLAEAHERGIVHRDIKPANLFVVRSDGGDDLLKVLDFGLARVLAGDASASSPSPVTPEGVICGTPAFISPEAVSGELCDARSDVYSLGAAMYFMLTGTVVFPHLTISESILAHTGRKPEPPSSRVADVPKDLEQIILRCLEKNATHRFASANALRDALRSCKDASSWTRWDAVRFWDRFAARAHSALLRASPPRP